MASTMVVNLMRYWTDSQAMLLAVGGVIFVLELWLIFEASAAVGRALSGGGQSPVEAEEHVTAQ